MSETVRVDATLRTEFGKGASRRARRDGQVPAVLYGHGIDPKHFNLPAKEFARVLRSGGSNSIVSLHAGGDEHLAITKTVVVHPTRNQLQHVDFQVVRRGERISVEVPVVLTGSVVSGGTVEQELTVVQLEAEALHIPDQIEVSIDGLEIGTKITAADLKLPEGSVLVTDPDRFVVQISEPRDAQTESELEAEAPAGAESDESSEES